MRDWTGHPATPEIELELLFCQMLGSRFAAAICSSLCRLLTDIPQVRHLGSDNRQANTLFASLGG